MDNVDIKSIHNYWSNICNIDGGENSSILYRKSDFRTKLIGGIICNCFPNPNVKIFELGCNIGRNLNYLYNLGYKKLTGVEINSKAISLMREYFREMFDNSNIIISTIEDYIKVFDNNEFDLSFTLAVLEHIHPDSDWIFDDMVRISNNIIIIENETDENERVFKRKYKDVFEKRGMKEVVGMQLLDKQDRDIFGYFCRVFTKGQNV